MRHRVLATLSLALLTPTAAGQCELARFESPAAFDRDRFGDWVAISGPWAWLSARGEDAMYIAQDGPQGWNVVARASHSLPGSRFTGPVALDGTRAAVLAEERIVVFDLTPAGWTETAILEASDHVHGKGFETTPCLAGDTLVIGAPKARGEGGQAAGRAYVFSLRNGAWTQIQRLGAFDGRPGDAFGFSVALSGATLMVGAARWDDVEEDVGCVYVYERAADRIFDRRERLVSSDPDAQDAFGSGLAIDGDLAVVRAFGDEDGVGTNFAGTVTVFERDGSGSWSERQRIAPNGGHHGFATGMAVRGETLYLGAYLAGDSFYDYPGNVGVWRPSPSGEYRAVQELRGDVHTGAFGKSVGVDGRNLVTGAERGGTVCDNASCSGAAYFFSLLPHEATSFCDANPNSTGFPAHLVLEGCTRVGENDLAFSASRVPAGSGTFFFGDRALTPVPFGDGLRCVGGATFRLATAVTTDTGGATLRARVDLTGGRAAGRLTAGSTWFFQLAYRDASAAAGFNTSDALEITFAP